MWVIILEVAKNILFILHVGIERPQMNHRIHCMFKVLKMSLVFVWVDSFVSFVKWCDFVVNLIYIRL